MRALANGVERAAVLMISTVKARVGDAEGRRCLQKPSSSVWPKRRPSHCEPALHALTEACQSGRRRLALRDIGCPLRKGAQQVDRDVLLVDEDPEMVLVKDETPKRRESG